MQPSALLLAESETSLVPVVVMVMIAAMVIVTIRQITANNTSQHNKQQDDGTPPHYLSSSSDPRGARVITHAASSPSDDESAPIDMSRGEPSMFTDEDVDDRSTPIAIKSFNFRTFDADTGPPDYDCFYDELITELYDQDTGRVWRTSFFVATPAGLMKLMRDERWGAMFGNNHIIVPRYDRAAIVDAILRQMNGAWEQSSEDGTENWRG